MNGESVFFVREYKLNGSFDPQRQGLIIRCHYEQKIGNLHELYIYSFRYRARTLTYFLGHKHSILRCPLQTGLNITEPH